MPAGNYTYSDVKNLLNGRVHGKITSLVDARVIINSAVRTVLNDLDLRGSKRKSALTSNLFRDVYTYPLPVDLKGLKIIDVIPQVRRSMTEEWDLVTEEEFDRKKSTAKNLIALASDDLARTLKIAQVIDDESLVIANFEGPDGDGDTWSGFGDAVTDSDIKEDGTDYIQGAASIRYQDNADTAATTQGVQNKGLTAQDLSQYLAKGAAFVWGRLTSYDTDITQANLRIGSDTANYYEISDSQAANDQPFQTGWNLLRFDMTSKAATGAPVDTALDYVAIYWTKSANTHLTDSDQGFDYLVIKEGEVYSILYYTKYLWQTTGTVAYKEESDADTDTLSVDAEELELIIDKAWELAAQELRDYEDVKLAKESYTQRRNQYTMNNPSEAMNLLSMQYELDSVSGRDRSEQAFRFDS